VADADCLDLVVRPSRLRIEDAGWNFLRFITWVLQGDGFRCRDREKLRFASRPGRRGNGVKGDFAVERTDCHKCIEGRVARQLLNLVRTKLHYRDLVRLHARGAQDARSLISFGAGFLLELLPASPEDDHSTTKFLRTMATVASSPINLAVLRLMIKSNFVGACIGRSAARHHRSRRAVLAAASASIAFNCDLVNSLGCVNTGFREDITFSIGR
jgi:hypothetical protein